MSTEKTFIITELGGSSQALSTHVTSGNRGSWYIVANIKNIQDANVGDTVTLVSNPAKNPLPGYKKAKPMVFAEFILSTVQILKD